MKLLNHITKPEIVRYANLVEYSRNQVVCRTLIQNDSLMIMLYALDQGEQMSAYSHHGKAMIQVLEGKAQASVNGDTFHLCNGETIALPVTLPHTFFAIEQVKLLLTIVF